jgi:large repetitive protein
MRRSRLAGVLVAGLVVAATLGAAAGTAFAQGVTPSTTTLSADNNPAVTGQEVTFTANVGGNGVVTPTGTVEFQNGGTDIPGCSDVMLDGNGNAQCQVADGFAVTGSPYAISALYSGDEVYATSNDSIGEVVNQDSSSVGLTADNNAAVTGQEVTFTASVSGAAPGSSNPTPTGTIEFQNGGTDIPGCSNVGLDDNGDAQCQIADGLAASGSPYAITATYSGDSNFTGNTGDLSEVVDLASTSTSAESSPTTLYAGQAAELTANITVTSPGSTAVGSPTGTVDFESDGTGIAGCTVTVSSQSASCFAPASSVQGGTITATYSGDGNFATSTSSGVNVKKADANVTMTSSASKGSVSGQVVTFVATVAATTSPEAFTPTGSISFVLSGTGTQPTCAGGDTQRLSAQDLATCTISLLASNTVNGVEGVEATYSGDTNFNEVTSSTGRVNQKVAADGTTLDLTGAPKSPKNGSNDNVTAVVVPDTPGGGTITGFVSFTVTASGSPVTCAGGSNTIALTDGAAVCTLLDVSSSLGPYSVSASYGTSANYLGSSERIKVNVKAS